MANIELRQLRHLVALGKLLSFTKAAKELGITQSALTRSIQAIEGMAQVRLFDRDRGRVALTEAGKAYLKRAANLLRDADDLDRMLQQTSVAEVGEVQFGITSAVARALLPDILTRELDDRPQLRTKILIRSPENVIELVQSEEIEFCVCGEQPVLPASLRATIIGTFPLSLLVRSGHPLLSSSGKLDLREYPLILSGQMSLSEHIPEIASPFVLSQPRIIMDEIGILAHIAASSDAIWLSTPYAMSDELQRGVLRELPLPSDLAMSFRVVMYSHNRRTLSPAARRLLNLMRNEMGRMMSSDPR